MKILAVDLYNLAFPFFAVRPDDEEWTYNHTIKIISRAVDEMQPNDTIVCTEGSLPCFRKEIFPLYKHDRSPPPQIFLDQISQILNMSACKGWSVVDPLDCEADDAVASVAAQSPEDAEVALMTRDKDLYACLSSRVSLLQYKAGQFSFHSKPECLAKFGVSPDRMTEYLAICGDAADNISGVPGLGPKKAVEIISNYSSVFDAIENPYLLKPLTAKKLIEGRSLFHLSHELVNLRTDVEVLQPI